MADAGPGIAEADLPHVFDRFYRADTARNTPGTGLGLSIVAQTIAQHGGWVKAGRSAQGGAEFTVHLPGSISPEELNDPVASGSRPIQSESRDEAALERLIADRDRLSGVGVRVEPVPRSSGDARESALTRRSHATSRHRCPLRAPRSLQLRIPRGIHLVRRSNMFGKKMVVDMINRSAENEADRRSFLEAAGLAGLGVVGGSALLGGTHLPARRPHRGDQ